MATKCATCNFPPLIGSRCATCWVDRQARAAGINERKWFRDGQKEFTLLLVGRYMAIASGLELTLPIMPLFEVFRKERMKFAAETIAEIINRADQAARREYERSTDRAADSVDREEDRGSVGERPVG